MPRRFTRLHQLATTLLLAAACSGAPEPEQPSDGTQPLCATCAPRAGGETSDFGTACFAECGEIEPARPLTEEELRRFEVDRALALLRDGVMTPIGWLPFAHAGGTSRTDPSTLDVRFRPGAEPRISTTELCGPRIFFLVGAELETSDGALQAPVTGTLFSNGNGTWLGDFGADLADVRGTADLRLAEAWSEAKGTGQREGELYVSLELDETQLSGTIYFSVGYASWGRGLASLDGSPPRAGAPIYGQFPLNDCAPEVATPIGADEPLPEAAGQSAAQLAQEAYAFLSERCGERWPGAWRSMEPGEFTLQLEPTPAADVCLHRFHDAISVSWAATGSFGSADGQLRSEIRRTTAVVSEGAVVEFKVEGSLPGSGAPIGTARCLLAEGDVYWTSDVRIPREDGPHACLSSEGYDYCTN